MLSCDDVMLDTFRIAALDAFAGLTLVDERAFRPVPSSSLLISDEVAPPPGRLEEGGLRPLSAVVSDSLLPFCETERSIANSLLFSSRPSRRKASSASVQTRRRSLTV